MDYPEVRGCKLQYVYCIPVYMVLYPKALTHQPCCETCDSAMEISCYHDFLNHLLQVVDATRVLAERRNVGKVLLRVETTSRE